MRIERDGPKACTILALVGQRTRVFERRRMLILFDRIRGAGVGTVAADEKPLRKIAEPLAAPGLSGGSNDVVHIVLVIRLDAAHAPHVLPFVI